MAGSDPQSRLLQNWLVLGLVATVSPHRLRRIEARYGSLERAAEAGPEGWRREDLLRPGGDSGTLRPASGGRFPEVLSRLEDTRRWAARQADLAGSLGVTILRRGEEGYPPLLGVAPSPPPVIYVRGDCSSLDRPAVAVVGARRAGRYGMRVARGLAAGLARSGLAVVSGGARGIDTEAHLGSLDAGGPTIAVMGCGLDVAYPPENAGLFARVERNGLLVSEFPFGAAPLGRNFPLRNRVIAGLCLGVVVVEGKEGSGSLITARKALEADREVMAVPGPVTAPLSEGPNGLIAEGAALVRSAKDVVEALPWWAGVRVPEGCAAAEPAADGRELAAELRAVLDLLDLHEGRTADDIGEALALGPGEVLGRLTALEIEGWIEQTPGGRYARRK